MPLKGILDSFNIKFTLKTAEQNARGNRGFACGHYGAAGSDSCLPEGYEQGICMKGEFFHAANQVDVGKNAGLSRPVYFLHLHDGASAGDDAN